MKLQESMKELLNRELEHGEAEAVGTLLSGEIAAVDAYNYAMQNVNEIDLIPTLETGRNSHAMRVQVLQSRLDQLHAKHPSSGGIWGGFTRTIQHVAGFLGDKVMMSVLAAGEDFGFEQYHSHLNSLDTETREMVERELLPMQARTLETMSMLCAFMNESKDKAVHG